MTPASRTNFELVKQFHARNGYLPGRSAHLCALEKRLSYWLYKGLRRQSGYRYWPEVMDWMVSLKLNPRPVGLKRPVIDPRTGTRYESLKDAGIALGVTTPTIWRWVKRGLLFYATERPQCRSFEKENAL